MAIQSSSAAQHTPIASPVLVLGATSLIGRFLVQRLAEAQIHTVAISREHQVPISNVDWIIADLTALDLRIGSRPQLVFSTSPIWILPPALPALHRAGISRLVAFSSTSRFTKESSRLRREREMAGRLAEAEEATQSFCEKHGIAWTILRPTLIYAEGGDRNVSRIARLIERFGILPLAGAGTGKRQPVHAEDLAVGALEAATAPATKNRAYNVPGGETLTYREMSERIFEALGRRPRIVTIPPRVWLLGSALLGPFIPGITPAIGSRMSEDLTFDPGPAKLDFSWHPRDFRPLFKEAVARGDANEFHGNSAD